jgi:serine/threonine protein kinase
MMHPIEQAVREQIELLESEQSTAAEFAQTMAQFSGASNESQVLVSQTLETFRSAGGLSDRVAFLIASWVLSSPTRDVDGATVDLHRDSGMPWSPDADSAVSMEIGRVLRDRYVIQERLGAGGRGTVFKALDRYRSSLPDAEQYVALKVLHAGRDCPDQTIGDLRRELHCGQVLSHQNIVNVYEMDRDGDVVFFTMELLEGELLSDVIGRMRPAAMQRLQAMQIIRQLGAGLEHAHERGVVHGDLKPRNLLVTHEGQLRILDFGAAHTVARAQSDECASTSGTPAYASCEMLEGRAADPRDDLYALACICYELLTGAHPFAARPATVARNFGVKATRPAGLTGQQWRTLQTGLSWHRAGRSMGIQAFVQGLTHHIAEKPPTTSLKDLAATSAAKPLLRSHAVVVSIAGLVIAGVCIAQLTETSARKLSVEAATRSAPETATIPAPVTAPSADPPLLADASDAGARPAGAKTALDGTSQAKPIVRQSPSTISVDGYQVSVGDRFVEIRVHRDQLQKNASFAWWTEPATAKRDVDYVHQAKAIQTFATERRSTRFYVKLLPESSRLQRDYFYVAIAQPGRARNSESVKRIQIWLPTSRDHMQASR